MSASTITRIANPGGRTVCGLRMTNCRPAASVLHQSAVGGWVPRPRKDNPATAEMSCGTLWLEDTAMVLYAFDVDDTLEAANGAQ